MSINRTEVPMDGEVFYMVWNPFGRAPTVRHASEYAATAEANRLAVTHPGQRFYVLEAQQYFEHNAVRHVALERPLPF
jgi:hypothetical protein